MDQMKIGKFIAECRKNVHLTQAELAEKLNISDRAVSKWENGKSMPDSGIMLELCSYLEITVNELLKGEKINLKSYEKVAEENLLKLKMREEQANKKLLNFEWVICFTNSISYIVLIYIASYMEMSNILRVLLIFLAIILFTIGIISSMKIEREVGYYECSKCHYKYIPNNLAFWFSMHIGRTRFLRCPKCYKKSWNKKVLSK